MTDDLKFGLRTGFALGCAFMSFVVAVIMLTS